MSSANFYKAKHNKDDEYYTQYRDIEKELIYYKEYLKDKIIFCNCDNDNYSNFWKFFKNKFYEFGLKKLICIYFSETEFVHKAEFDGTIIKITDLLSQGDFRSAESIEVLQEADIVITNPPFSLFTEFIDIMTEYNKKYLIIGNKNSICCNNVLSGV